MSVLDWKLKDTYTMGFFIYFIKTIILYGLFFLILLFMFLAARNTHLLTLLWMAILIFFHFFGQFAYGLPIYYLFKDAGYPKVAQGFVWSSVIPLFLFAAAIIYLIINYEWKELWSSEVWT